MVGILEITASTLPYLTSPSGSPFTVQCRAKCTSPN